MKKRLILLCLLVLGLMLYAASGAEGMTPELTVNGSNTSASAAFNEAPLIRICAPGATGVRLLADRLDAPEDPEGWSRYFDRGEVMTILEEDGMRMYDRGIWRITAAYTTDDYPQDIDLAEAQVEWIEIGQGVTVQVEDWIAQLSVPDATLSSDSVARGEMLTVTVNAFQHKNEWYWIELERSIGDDDWEFMGHIDTDIRENGEAAFNLSTFALESGEYRLWLRCEAVGYEDNGAYLPFGVIQSAAALPEVSLQLSRSETLTSQDITLYANAPGADRLAVDITWDGNEYWHDDRSGGGDSGCWSWGCSDRGSYTLTLSAWFGDEVRQAEPATLNVSALQGDLDVPQLQNVPGVMSVGTGVEGSFGAVENAGRYGIELRYCSYDGDWETLLRFWRDADRPDATSLSIPAALFERQGLYRLEVHAVAEGWNGSHAEHQIMVTEPIEQALELRFNGSTDETAQCLSLERFSIDVDLPAEATAVRLLSGDDWVFFDAQDFHGVDWNMGRGEYTLLALATDAEPVWREENFDWDGFNWDDLYWGMMSNVVHLSVTAPYGQLENTVLSLPETVAQGQWLLVDIGGVEDAEGYHLRVIHQDENGQEDRCLYDEFYSAPGEYPVPTAMMVAGEEYVVRVWSDGVGHDSGMAQAPFIVTEGDDEAHFMVSSADVITRQRVICSIHAPGAEKIRLTCDAGLLSESDGEILVDGIDFERPGDYELRAITPEGDGWRLIGEAIVIHVTAPNGYLEVELDVPGTVAAEGTVDFTVTWRHNGVEYHPEVTLNTQQWENVPIEQVLLTQGETQTTGIYRIDGTDLDVGQTYIIEAMLRPEAPGYEITRRCAEIAAVEGQVLGSVTVSREELLRCDVATVTVDVPGATALWVYHGEGRWDGFIGSHAEETWDFYQVGINRVYARWTTQPIGDAQQVDYEALDWEGYTPVIPINVTALGTIGTPDFTLESEIVLRGEPFRLSFDHLQGLDEWYVGTLRDMDGRNVSRTYFWDERTCSLKIETADIPSDLYYLDVYAEAVGYEGAAVRLFVAVEEAQQALTVSLPDSPILTQERPLVMAYAPGALSIAMDITDPEGAVSPRHYEQAGELFREEVVFGASQGSRHVVFTASWEGGETQVSEADIRLIAPHGQRPNPTLHMSGQWHEGEDLSFWVDAGSALFIAVDIQDRQTQEYVWYDEEIRFDDWHYTIPAAFFTPGHYYNIIVYSTEVGFDANETLWWMAMLPHSPETLILPASLSEVEAEAFSGIAAQKIVIPGSVTNVAAGAFAGCPNIAVVEIEEGASGISIDAFENCGAFMIYGAPGSSAQSYANSNPWATFICLD